MWFFVCLSVIWLLIYLFIHFSASYSVLGISKHLRLYCLDVEYWIYWLEYFSFSTGTCKTWFVKKSGHEKVKLIILNLLTLVNPRAYSPADWLGDWVIDWLTDWLDVTDWLGDWLTNWWMDWLGNWNGWLTDWLSGWLTDCLDDWLTGWLSGWLTNWLTDWWKACLTDWLTDHDCQCLIDWLTDCVIDCSIGESYIQTDIISMVMLCSKRRNVQSSH